MKRLNASIYRCPITRSPLSLQVKEGLNGEVVTGTFLSETGKVFEISHGLPNFIYPEKLLASDEEFQQKYDNGATKYEVGLKWLFESFYLDEDFERKSMVKLLDVKPGARVLEVGCGTGRDTLNIASLLNGVGEIYAQDISKGMLAIAKEATSDLKIPVEFSLGNAAYLPFQNGVFDALFHFGGLNQFGDIPRAIAEMTRVVKIGGKVVIGDESVAPWLRDQEFGKILVNANRLYEHTPPMAILPVNAFDVCLRWIIANAFYIIDYTVGDASPRVDLDLPIPGKGDSLRSRFAKRTRPAE